MQTINLQFQVDNDVYESFMKSGQEMRDKIKEFILFELGSMDDGYPTIGTEEAKRRVAEAVEHYRRSPEDFTPFDDAYWNDLDRLIDAIEAKA